MRDQQKATKVKQNNIADQNYQTKKQKKSNVTKPYARASFSQGPMPVRSAACPDDPAWGVLRTVLGIDNRLGVRYLRTLLRGASSCSYTESTSFSEFAVLLCGGSSHFCSQSHPSQQCARRLRTIWRLASSHSYAESAPLSMFVVYPDATRFFCLVFLARAAGGGGRAGGLEWKDALLHCTRGRF